DDGATAVSQAAQAGFNPRASDLITRESLYRTWLVGNFGSADSPTAVEYGPRLMSALTYTWSDVKRMGADAGAQKAIDKAMAAGAMILILGAIQHAPIGMGWRLLFAIVATVSAVMITKPVVSFKSMAGLDPTRHYVGSLLRQAGSTALGLVGGQKLSDRQVD